MSQERVIYPVNYLEINEPLIFLAGPIQGALDWQKEAIEIIHEAVPNLWIANPRREYFPDDPEGQEYIKQIKWERYHLRKAETNGVVMFWLAKEVEHDPKRAYAQTSRVELAEIKGKIPHTTPSIKLVVGIEDGFSGARYLRYIFQEGCPYVPLLDTLQNTCQKAVEIITEGG